MATWDVQLLKAEMTELKLADYDMQLLGFPELELRKFGIVLNEGQADPEITPEPPAKPVSRSGDLWLLGKHRLLCGDATSESDMAMCLGGTKPVLCASDPPYGVEYDADWRNRADRANGKPYGASAIGQVTNDHREDWTDAWKLFPGDVIYCWHAGRHASSVQHSLENAGFEIVSQIMLIRLRPTHTSRSTYAKYPLVSHNWPCHIEGVAREIGHVATKVRRSGESTRG